MDTEGIAKQLGGIIKGDVLVDVFNRVAFSTDASIYQIMPACVVAVRDAEDVASVVKFARTNGLSVAPRGAGTGLAGESLTDGIVIDTSRYMKEIVEVSCDGGKVVCQPGVVLEDLNDHLAAYGTKIGPDPSSGNRAVVGGVVANNATGAHSLVYGYIAEYVESVEMVTAEGEIVTITNNVDVGQSDTAGRFATAVQEVLAGKDELIANSLPKTKRNRCGYNISGLLGDGKIDLAKLIAGSEGTFGIFTRLTLRTVKLPACKGVVQFEFANMTDMARAVPIIIESGAASCELMDERLISMARKAFIEYHDVLPKGCAAILSVEFNADDQSQLAEKLDRADNAVGGLASGRSRILDEAAQKHLSKSRKDAVPLLHGEKGDSHPIAFIEDVSVDNTRLDEYIAGLNEIGAKYDIPMAFYGHAGDGELHVRPYLDLSSSEDVEKMRQIAKDVFDLAWSLGGTISGEHADGLLRAAFIRDQYGDEYYELLKAVKNVFDPDGIMNPGKIINDDKDVMVKNLRAENLVLAERLETNLYFKPDEFKFEIEQCNGDGVCISTQPGSRMCPVYRAMGDELACSRAKANLLRAWITGVIKREDFESDEFKRVLGLCINCKMCSVECPSGVDISKLMVEARSRYVAVKGLTRAEYVLVHNRLMSAMGSMFAPLSNFALRLKPVRWLMELVTGIDRRRKMPAFHRGSFIDKGREYLERIGPLDSPMDKVAFFVDSYVNYNDHELGFAVIDFLRYNNIEVLLPDQRPAPLAAICYGDLKTARGDLEFNVKHLYETFKKGYKVVCSEPSAALCLKEEMRLLLDSKEGRVIASSTYELMDYLNKLDKVGRLKEPPAGSDAGYSLADAEFAYHSPCHLCALGVGGAGVELLGKMTNVRVKDISSGCCGLAGTCGMQKKNFDLSVAIGSEMAEALGEVDTEYAMTECSACKMQIEQLTDKKVLHPIEVLAGAYGL
jgi:FAD/FMN-containing dehydrogenase/Fe-S oxidoreductase